MVEQLTLNQRVPGSSPGRLTNLFSPFPHTNVYGHKNHTFFSVLVVENYASWCYGRIERGPAVSLLLHEAKSRLWLAPIIVAGTLWAMTMGTIPLLAQNQTAQPKVAIVNPRDISGFWELSYDSRKVPAAELAPTVTKAVIDANIKHDEHAIRYCTMLGTPFIMNQSRPIDIRVGTNEVMIAADTQTQSRHLYFRPVHIDSKIYDPSMNGDSIAHWDGDTLVVDTIAFSDENGLREIPGGGYRTAKSHLVERYRLVENGSLLSVTFTWDDPTMFRTPHTYEFRYHRLPPQYQPLPTIPCDSFDEARGKFLDGPGNILSH